MLRRTFVACGSVWLGALGFVACSSDDQATAHSPTGDAGVPDAASGGASGGSGAGQGGKQGGAGGSAGSNSTGGAAAVGGNAGTGGGGIDGGSACLPLDQVPKPSTLGVELVSSCSMPSGACGGTVTGTSWGLSDVCLDASTLFPQAAARCSGVTFGSIIQNDVHGSASFTADTVDLDLRVDVTAFLDFPNGCHFCRCSDLETELIQAGLTGASCSPVCDGGSCSCTVSSSMTVQSNVAYTLSAGTLTSGSVSLSACATASKLSLRDASTHTTYTLLPRTVIDTPEICDGKDNDGNGKVDDNPVECPPCSSVGVCGEGVDPQCKGASGWSCVYTSPSWEATETKCDHKDNDCDGQIDMGLPCREICDGKDNDGNGKIDDDPLDNPTCGQAGVCKGTVAQCNGASGFSCPVASAAFEAAETKCDGLDNDCNGVVDERCCAPTDAKIYYSYQIVGDSGVSGVVIERSNLDGSGKEPLVRIAPPAYVIDVAVDPVGKKIYWASLLDDMIRRANMDGSGVEDALTGDNQPRLALDVADRWIFWRGNGGVQRSELGDLTKTTAVMPGQLPMTLTVDAQDGWVFMADASNVTRANVDGSGIITITGTNVGYLIEGIAVDPVGRKVYWAGGGLHRANLDLSNPETVLSLSYPVQLRMAPVARRVYWSETTGNRIGSLLIGSTTPAYVDYPEEVICGDVVDCPP